MNSLTALMEWIETSPDDAVNFIDKLASEFRILIDFSDRKQVSLREEVELCRIHTELMGRRLGSEITLNVDAQDMSAMIPPAIFHTLVENAFTHNDYRNQSLEFKLTSETLEKSTRFTLSTPLVSPKKSPFSTGLGTRYVIARLEEFCGKAFRFRTEQVGSHWVSNIEILKG